MRPQGSLHVPPIGTGRDLEARVWWLAWTVAASAGPVTWESVADEAIDTWAGTVTHEGRVVARFDEDKMEAVFVSALAVA